MSTHSGITELLDTSVGQKQGLRSCAVHAEYSKRGEGQAIGGSRLWGQMISSALFFA